MTRESGIAKNDMQMAAAIHQRWMLRRNRRQEDPGYVESWWAEQCGACRHWIPLSGALGRDYGACANSESDFDGTVRFEHDGCDEFDAAGSWMQPDE